MQRRSGSTLTEVLIATMVLSIGIISVGTLFPLSLARSVRANQLTQATIHRYNCEAQIEGYKLNSYWLFCVEPGLNADAMTVHNHFPGLFGDDDGDGGNDIDLTTGGFEYGVDTIPVVDNMGNPNPLFKPGTGFPGIAGIDDDGDGVFDELDELGWTSQTSVSDDVPIIDQNEVQFGGADAKRIVIDPLGWHRMTANNHQHNFGGDVLMTDPKFATIGARSLPRLNGGFRGNNYFSTAHPRTRPMYWKDRIADGSPIDEFPANGGYGFDESQAEAMVTLQDQYSTVLDVPFEDEKDMSMIGTRFRFDLANVIDDRDLASIQGTLINGTQVRVTFFGVKNAFAPTDWTESRLLFAPGATPMGPTEIVLQDSLPAEFQIERMVFQYQQQDFTWMITARLTSPPPTRPQMDVVVFHKRRFDPEDERLFIAQQNKGNLNVVEVSYSGDKPFAKKGGWMFDVENCLWYQIADLKEAPGKLILTLEHRLRDRRTAGVPDDTSKVAVAFMRGIVDVFPIGPK